MCSDELTDDDDDDDDHHPSLEFMKLFAIF